MIVTNEAGERSTIAEQDGKVLVSNYSGPRTLEAGETREYNFNLIVTPFHPIDTDAQWATRFYYRYEPVDAIKATGATVINIHHATAINPWILTLPRLQSRRPRRVNFSPGGALRPTNPSPCPRAGVGCSS